MRPDADRAARPEPAGQIDAPATTSATAHADDHYNQASDPPHSVDPPDRDAALTPALRAAAIHTHQQAAMPEEYLDGRTTDPTTWLRTPENLDRLAAFTRAASKRRRAI